MMVSIITQYGKITCGTTVTEPRFSGASEVYKSLHHRRTRKDLKNFLRMANSFTSRDIIQAH